MKHNRLILKELEETLNFWEDLCLMGHLGKKSSKINDIQIRNIVKSLPGIKGVSNYEELRIHLRNKKYFEQGQFLPSPGVDSWQDKVHFCQGAPLNAEATSFFPYMMSHWVKTKKVFRLKNSDIIPLIDPNKNHYLKLLPCDSFVISFEEPMEVGFETSPLVKTYIACIVVRSGDIVSTFWIPNDVESKSLKQSERQQLKIALSKKSVKEKLLERFLLNLTNPGSAGRMLNNWPYFVNVSFNINHPLMFYKRIKKPDQSIVDMYFDLLGSGSKVAVLEEYNGRFRKVKLEEELNFTNEAGLADSVRFFQLFFRIVNGFCYMISEIKPKKLERTEKEAGEAASLPPYQYNWSEIPITKVDYLEDNPPQLGSLKVVYSGGEKSPHIRRGHWRNMVKKDGTSEKIWIEQAIIREDKLATEGLSGNVTLLKGNRKSLTD